ncbi:hypothetical protein WJX82_009760 [Trebouxia sp. C0006]
MSSEDEDVVLEKHRGKVATSLARPATARRQSEESQSSKLSQVVASSRQSRDVQPSRKSATAAAAPPDDDSDDDAHMLQKHQNKLLTQAKVPVKPVAAEKLKTRPGLLQPGQKALERQKGMAQAHAGPAKAADTSDADSDEEHWKSLSAKAAKPKLQVQTVKAVKAIQAETSEDFSSADEWQTAKAGLRRASVEQATSSLTAAARPPSRRTTAERQPASRGSPAIPLALPTRPPTAPVNRLQPQARPEPTSAPDRASNLACQSRLNPPENTGAESNGAMTGLHAPAPAGATQSSFSPHPRAGEQPERAEQAAQRAGLQTARAHRHTERAPDTRLPPEAGHVPEATLPLSLLQLAEADMPKSDQQWPISRPTGQSLQKGQSRGTPSGTAYQAGLPVGNGAGPSGAGDYDRLEGGRANSGDAPLQLQQLQTSLVQTLTSTVESAMAQMRGDMQQLDGKWSQWWRQSSDMCDNLQHQMSLLCSQQEVTTQRMQQLETQVAEHKQPQQAVPLGMGGEGSDLGREDPRVSSVLERLSQLEGRVGNQLDQLLQLQQQQTGGYVQDRWHDASALHEQRHDSPQRSAHGRGLDTYHVRDRHAAQSEGHGVGAAASSRSKSGSPAKRSRGAGGGGGDEHADWLVTLGEQLGGLQAQMQTTASTSSLQAVQHETAELRSALDARSAEASLYRKQYESLCCKLDSLEGQQRQASVAARAKEQSEQASAAALDNRLTTLEAHASRAQQEAAAANSTSNNLQQRFAAMEWRVEQTASSCAATLRTMTAKHERLAGTLAVVKEAANFAEAKCSALGSELARMHRQSARTGDTKENKPLSSAIISASARS